MATDVRQSYIVPMKDTGMTLFGRKVYESDVLRDATPIVVMTEQRVPLSVRAETDADGVTRFIANVKDEQQ